jgi:hypothetical protein
VRGSAVGAKLAKGLERLISLTWIKNRPSSTNEKGIAHVSVVTNKVVSTHEIDKIWLVSGLA